MERGQRAGAVKPALLERARPAGADGSTARSRTSRHSRVLVMRVIFEPAAAEHDAALRRLMAANPMEGEVTLAFEREPSYFLASDVQAPFHQVVVGRDAATGEIVGVGTRAVRRGFVNGAPADVGYLADLRLDPRYRGGTVIGRAYGHLAALHRDGRARLYFTMIAEGNRRALSTIAAGRAGLPPYRDLGRFLSPAVNLRRRKPPRRLRR